MHLGSAILAAALGLLPGTAGPQGTESTASTESPLLDCVHRPTDGVGFHQSYSADISHDTEGKALTVHWKLHGEGGTSSSFATRYWPTAHAVLEPYTWIVAGTSPEGFTVIEKWELATAHGRLKVPCLIEQASVDPRYSGSSVWILPSVKKITTVLHHSPAELTTVKFLLLGGPAKRLLYVSFAEDSSLWKMDLESPGYPLSPIAGQTASYPIVIPELTARFDTIWGMEHTDHGRAFVFGVTETIPRMTLTLVDANGDLVPDDILRLDSTSWTSGGWGDSRRISCSW